MPQRCSHENSRTRKLKTTLYNAAEIIQPKFKHGSALHENTASEKKDEKKVVKSTNLLSLPGAAKTTIIFFIDFFICRDKNVFVNKKHVFIATNHVVVATNLVLSRHKIYRDKNRS